VMRLAVLILRSLLLKSASPRGEEVYTSRRAGFHNRISG